MSEAMELVKAKEELATLEPTIAELEFYAQSLAVTGIQTDEEFAFAVEQGKAAKVGYNLIEERRKAFTVPLNTVVKMLNDVFRGPLGRYEGVEATIKRCCVARVRALEEARRQEEERLRREAEIEQARLRREAEEAAKAAEVIGAPEQAEVLREQAQTIEVPAEAPQLPLAPKIKGFTARKLWRGEVTDLKAFAAEIADGTIPVRCIAVVFKELNDAITAHEGKVPWRSVKVYQMDSAALGGR